MYYDINMKEFQERRVLRRIIFSRFSFAFLAVILVFVVYSTVKIYIRSREAGSINQMVEKEIEDLKTKKEDLSATVKNLESESGQEEEIRSRFPVQKPGEKAVMIVEEETKTQNPPEQSSSGFFPNLPRFFRGIWQFIKNIF